MPDQLNIFCVHLLVHLLRQHHLYLGIRTLGDSVESLAELEINDFHYSPLTHKSSLFIKEGLFRHDLPLVNSRWQLQVTFFFFMRSEICFKTTHSKAQTSLTSL